MDNRKETYNIIKAVSGWQNIIAVPRLFINLTGDWQVAAVLSQLIYWSDKAKREDGYFYKSNQELQEELGVTDYTVRKVKELPYVETKVIKANGAPTTHYRINFELLYDAISQLSTVPFVASNKSDSLPATNPLTETTIHKTTQEIKEINVADKSATKSELTAQDNSDNIIDVPDNDDYCEGAMSAVVLSETEVALVAPEPSLTKARHNSSEQWQMYLSLCELTENDPALNIQKVHGMVKRLRKAGYTAQDVRDFQAYWRGDSRYKRYHRPPYPEEVYTDIAKSKSIYSAKSEGSLEDTLKAMFGDSIPQHLLP